MAPLGTRIISRSWCVSLLPAEPQPHSIVSEAAVAPTPVARGMQSNVPFTGCTDAGRLFREVRERGFGGTVQTVRRYVATLRDGTAIPVPAPIPSPRAITSWIMRRREPLSEEDEVRLGEVCLACPDTARAREIAQGGVRPVHEVRHRRRHRWPDPAVQLRRRRRPCRPHQETIKRQMYGRASFHVLAPRLTWLVLDPRGEGGERRAGLDHLRVGSGHDW
ncbi:hypothetical protein SVEN_6170 [Streptomyces venezuelae ATCC 10712]|uniref:Uncharacterized protein n=1 Tax=Streptomyces venezuelae (strain ATCC 10712 / CBS 650.69 / DSM 40230 / JCM 4526 / NBRC 13096 / PD 04745) TaxID=953739 RepID=F2RDG4_STRVP|nr:hypothetical protein SVEN_6170 [Streptomyces venezuelae ATCC 10712]